MGPLFLRMIIAIVLVGVLACRRESREPSTFDRHGISGATAASTANVTFDLHVQVEGIVAFVRKPKVNPNRMWAILLNTKNSSNLPPKCQAPERAVRHFSAIRIKQKYLDPGASLSGGEVLAIFPLDGEDVSFIDLDSVCPNKKPFSLVNDSWMPKMKDFAAGLGEPCNNCATDKIGMANQALVSGRFLFDREAVTVDKPIKYKGSVIDWCVDKVGAAGCQSYEPLGQQVRSDLVGCSLAEGKAVVLALTKGANEHKIPLYPEAGRVEVELVNFLAEDVFSGMIMNQKPSNMIPHFNWFYQMSTKAQQHAGTCSIPKTDKINEFAGKPYCPILELDSVN